MQRVAAIDVAKASGMICARVPHAAISGKRVTRVGQWKSASAGASRPSFERGSPGPTVRRADRPTYARL